MPGKEAPATFSEATRKLNNLKGNISAYKTEIEADKVVFPSEVPLPFGARIPLPTGSDTARLRGKYQSLLMGVKDLYELGALTGPDMGIISEQLTNPASKCLKIWLYGLKKIFHQLTNVNFQQHQRLELRVS
jgi:hypothetical protein